MRWSWTVARIKGIDVDIHATFLLLLAWIALADYQQAHTASAAVVGVLLTLAIFLSVVLHEFGHALMAARFGVKTKSITLLPIGGVARLERMPSRPREELLIAIAGPAVTQAVSIPVIGGQGGGPWLDGRMRMAHAAIGYTTSWIESKQETYAYVARTALEALEAYAEDVRAARQIKGGIKVKAAS